MQHFFEKIFAKMLDLAANYLIINEKSNSFYPEIRVEGIN